MSSCGYTFNESQFGGDECTKKLGHKGDHYDSISKHSYRNVSDPTRIEIETDPLKRRMIGVTHHGHRSFDVPFISKIAHNLYQGGCTTGLRLPGNIEHVVSLYPWERYSTHGNVRSELYVEMFDHEDQGMQQVSSIALWVNACRQSGPVLVHCQAGLNRSSLIAARAIYLDTGDSGADILADLRTNRSDAVLCNPAFEAEVLSWAKGEF